MRISDWSSDVCSSDLRSEFAPLLRLDQLAQLRRQLAAGQLQYLVRPERLGAILLGDTFKGVAALQVDGAVIDLQVPQPILVRVAQAVKDLALAVNAAGPEHLHHALAGRAPRVFRLVQEIEDEIRSLTGPFDEADLVQEVR